MCGRPKWYFCCCVVLMAFFSWFAYYISCCDASLEFFCIVKLYTDFIMARKSASCTNRGCALCEHLSMFLDKFFFYFTLLLKYCLLLLFVCTLFSGLLSCALWCCPCGVTRNFHSVWWTSDFGSQCCTGAGTSQATVLTGHRGCNCCRVACTRANSFEC